MEIPVSVSLCDDKCWAFFFFNINKNKQGVKWGRESVAGGVGGWLTQQTTITKTIIADEGNERHSESNPDLKNLLESSKVANRNFL